MTPHLAHTPVLQTERLTLRAPIPSDSAAFVAFFGSDRAKFVGGPMAKGPAWRLFAAEIGHWAIHGFGMFTVLRKGDDTPLGIVGQWYPEGWPETEVGWVIFDPAVEGTGIAHEAAKAAIDHAWTTLGWTEMVSYIDHGNDRSVALAKRLGATLDPDAAIPYPDKPCYVYRHPKPGAAA